MVVVRSGVTPGILANVSGFRFPRFWGSREHAVESLYAQRNCLNWVIPIRGCLTPPVKTVKMGFHGVGGGCYSPVLTGLRSLRVSRTVFEWLETACSYTRGADTRSARVTNSRPSGNSDGFLHRDGDCGHDSPCAAGKYAHEFADLVVVLRIANLAARIPVWSRRDRPSTRFTLILISPAPTTSGP